MFNCASTDSVESCPKAESQDKGVSAYISLQAGYRKKSKV
jgi:hypothetical protein